MAALPNSGVCGVPGAMQPMVWWISVPQPPICPQMFYPQNRKIEPLKYTYVMCRITKFLPLTISWRARGETTWGAAIASVLLLSVGVEGSTVSKGETHKGDRVPWVCVTLSPTNNEIWPARLCPTRSYTLTIAKASCSSVNPSCRPRHGGWE